MTAQRMPGWDNRADNEVLYGGEVLLNVADDGSSAVVLTTSIPSMPQRFVSMEVGDEGAWLRRSDGQDVRFNTDPILAEIAATIGKVRIEEIEFRPGGARFERNDVYEVPVSLVDMPVSGPAAEIEPRSVAPTFGM